MRTNQRSREASEGAAPRVEGPAAGGDPKPVAPLPASASMKADKESRDKGYPQTIESLRRALDELREFASVVNRSPVVVLKRRLAPGWPVEFVTENVRQFGYRADEFLSGAVSLQAVIHHDDVGRVETEVARQAEQGPAAFTLEYRLVTRSGDERWIEERNLCVRDDKGEPTYVHSALFDVTERKRLQEEVLVVSGREQARMSQDLHDIVGQSLTGIAILTKSLEHSLASRELPEAAEAAHLSDLLNEATAKMRQLSRGILPFEPTSKGLAEAIEEYASGTRYLFGINCRFKADKSAVAVNDNVATHLYRIVQEAVNNVITHANASDVTIALTAAGKRTMLTIRDNGTGLRPSWNEPEGLGIRIMRYRATSIGADFDVRNAPGGGTIVACSLNEA